MTGVVVKLADAALIDGYTVAIALAALGVLLWTRCNNVWLVACGVAIGVIHALAA